jgi:hypothetical protein
VYNKKSREGKEVTDRPMTKNFTMLSSCFYILGPNLSGTRGQGGQINHPNNGKNMRE